MIMTRASRQLFDALEPVDTSTELPEWLKSVQAERAADRVREADRLATLAESRRMAVAAWLDYGYGYPVFGSSAR